MPPASASQQPKSIASVLMPPPSSMELNKTLSAPIIPKNNELNLKKLILQGNMQKMQQQNSLAVVHTSPQKPRPAEGA